MSEDILSTSNPKPQVMSLGRRSPGFSLGAEVELYDLRMYTLNPWAKVLVAGIS